MSTPNLLCSLPVFYNKRDAKYSECTVMPVNAVAENVFGTMGQSASLSSTSSFHFPRQFYPSLSRCDLLDRTAHPSTFQNLAHKVHQRTLTLARVSRTSASIHPSPAPPHPPLSIFPPKHAANEHTPSRTRADSSGASRRSHWAST